MAKRAWAQIQEKDVPSTSRVIEENSELNGLDCGYHTCLLTSPEPLRIFSGPHMDHQKCWPKTNRLPVISPGKMGLLGISKKLQFGVCNHGKPYASLRMTREGECFYRGEKEVGRDLHFNLKIIMPKEHKLKLTLPKLSQSVLRTFGQGSHTY